MRLKTATTVVGGALLVFVVLLAPTAGAARDVPVPTTDEQLDGLPALDATPRDGGLDFAGLDGRRSEPVETPIPFSLVGFELPARDTAAWFRTSVDGETWTDWEGVHVHDDEGPDPEDRPDGRWMSAPFWVGEARFIQTRVGEPYGPDDLGVHLVDSMGHGRTLAQRAGDVLRSTVASLTTGAPAAAQVNQPAIVTRSQWGANESLRSGAPSYSAGIDFAVVHHTAGTNGYSQAEAPAIVRGIYHYHTQSNGWNDIGYNFLVDRFGTIYEGRAGGMDKAVIGAHAGGFNTSSFGVSILGSYDGAAPSSASLEAVARVLAWKFDVHHVDAGGTTRATSRGSTRYAEGTTVTLNVVSGHRDVSATACPGAQLYSRLSWLRTRALELAQPMFIDPDASPSTLSVDLDNRVSSGPVQLTARLRPAGSWTLSINDADGTAVHNASGSGSTASVTWNPPTLRPGKYTYEFRSPGRRTATGEIRVEALRRIGSVRDPVGGAVQVSRVAFPQGGSAEYAVLARDDVFADAMAGGPLAATDGPLLFTGSDRLDSRVRSELERVLPAGRTVYVLGGTAALSDGVPQALSDRWEVRRLYGRERTETAAAVATVVLERTGTTTAMLARAFEDHQNPWADAIAGGAYGASSGTPVLLTEPDRLSPAAREVLAGLDHTIVLGGSAAVSDAVVERVPTPTERVFGPDRSGTAVAVAERLWGRTAGASGDAILFAAGYRPDSWTMPLAAAPLAARRDAPLLLVEADSVPRDTRAYLDRLGYGSGRPATGWVLGESASVGFDVVDEVTWLLR